VETRYLGEGVYDFVWVWPFLIGWVAFWFLFYVARTPVEKKTGVAGRETIPVEDECVEELSVGGWHEHPAAEPPWSVGEPAAVFQAVVQKF